MINEVVRRTALNWVGEEEIPGNMGWVDKEFERLMKLTGWKPSEAWCSYFVELVWKMSYVRDLRIVREINMICSASAVQTYLSFIKAGWLVNHSPEIGAIVVWQKFKNGKPHWSGHAGIVVDYSDKDFFTCEGNTNYAGKREGRLVLKKKRNYNFDVKNGLRLKGFIHVKQI